MEYGKRPIYTCNYAIANCTYAGDIAELMEHDQVPLRDRRQIGHLSAKRKTLALVLPIRQVVARHTRLALRN